MEVVPQACRRSLGCRPNIYKPDAIVLMPVSVQELEAEGSGRTYVKALWLMLRLRQACNHPWLLKPADTKAPAKPSAAQLAAARKLDPAASLCCLPSTA